MKQFLVEFADGRRKPIKIEAIDRPAAICKLFVEYGAGFAVKEVLQ